MCKRVVVKVGSSLLCPEGIALDRKLLEELAGQIAEAASGGTEIAVVSSGAIALGMSILKVRTRPRELAFLQAAAALGQHELMDAYRSVFARRGLVCAQLLLTWDDFDDRTRYLNAKHTLEKLLKFRSIPVINENDTVATEEIKFGDNDRLSALLASLIGADLLIILSDVDGLLDRKNNRLVRVVDKITPAVRALVCRDAKRVCVGGMSAKLDAAKIATDSGIPCIIAHGRRPRVICDLLHDASAAGTFFVQAGESLQARKRWIAFGVKPRGALIVDAGARTAVMNKKSLLAVGVVSATGSFESGDIVVIQDASGSAFARGRVRFSKIEIDTLKGRRAQKEVIHRDDIVVETP